MPWRRTHRAGSSSVPELLLLRHVPRDSSWRRTRGHLQPRHCVCPGPWRPLRCSVRRLMLAGTRERARRHACRHTRGLQPGCHVKGAGGADRASGSVGGDGSTGGGWWTSAGRPRYRR